MRESNKSSAKNGHNKITTKHSPPENISRYAQVTRLATDQSTDQEMTKNKLDEVDASLLKRIQKMLKLAQHPNTSEAEAKQALRASVRMLSAANLTEAEVMSQETEEEQNQRAGHSIVTIRHRDGKSVFLEEWSTNLSSAIECAFNVKYFYTSWRSHDRIEFTFYGLRDNTVAAVISFEAVFNLALTWAASRKDLKGRTERNCYLLGLSYSLYRMAKKEKQEEEKQAIENQKKALLKDKEKGAKEEKKRQERLQDPVVIKKENAKSATVADEEDDEIVFVSIKHGPKQTKNEPRVKNELVSSDEELESNLNSGLGEIAGEVSDDEFYDAGEEEEEEEIGDLKAEQRRFDEAFERRATNPSMPAAKNEHSIKTENHHAKTEEVHDVKPDIKKDPAVKEEEEAEMEVEVAAWQSHAQLVKFKETAERIAEDYLKEINTKLRHTKARKRQSKYDSAAYRKGQEDAKKVDLKRRRLEAE